MAIVIAPAMSQQASGNIGSINFTRWKGINVARTTYKYSDPGTPAQMTQRGLLSTLAWNWGGVLTPANRQTWEDRAAEVIFTNRIGGKYQPSGYQLFMKWNLQLKVIDDIYNQNAPVGIFNADIYELLLVLGPMNDIYTKLRTSNFDNVDCRAVITFRAGPFTSGGRRPIAPEYRLKKVRKPPGLFIDEPETTSVWYWYKAFGVFASGQRANTFEGQIYLP